MISWGSARLVALGLGESRALAKPGFAGDLYSKPEAAALGQHGLV